MQNQSKYQKIKLSTESVLTPTPTYRNTHYSAVNNINQDSGIDKPISDAYKAYDTDLARDNLENDNTAADLQDL